MSTKYHLRFPYATSNGAYLDHMFKLAAVASVFDYTGRAYQKAMARGHVELFKEVKERNVLSFFKHYEVDDYLWVFENAYDRNTIPYAYIYAKEKNDVVGMLHFGGVQVSQYRVLSMPDTTRLGVWIILQASRIH